ATSCCSSGRGRSNATRSTKTASRTRRSTWTCAITRRRSGKRRSLAHSTASSSARAARRSICSIPRATISSSTFPRGTKGCMKFLAAFAAALATKDYGYLPLFVGMRAGFFKDEGLDVQWLVVNTNVVVTALMAGEIDVAGAAGSAMRAATRGAPLKAIFFTHQRCTFVLVGAPEIKRVQDLKGKVIGI